jgi:ketosteroid isomerase-like protein
MPNPTLEQFEAAARAGVEAFNRRDFAAAFGGLPSDCEWHLPQNFAPEGVLVRPEQVCSWFDDWSESVPDWSNQLARVLEADDGVFVVLVHGKGSGRASGAAAVFDLGHIWELREGVPFRVREFATWEETLEAAGMSPALAKEVRRADH